MSALNMALKNLGRRKVRIVLTVSGIVIGIAMTFIIVTHDPIVVGGCTKVYTIRDGRIKLGNEAGMR